MNIIYVNQFSKHLLITTIFFLLIFVVQMEAQLVAGGITEEADVIIADMYVEGTVEVPENRGYLDIDGDGADDVAFVVQLGTVLYPYGLNGIGVERLNDSIQFCAAPISTPEISLTALYNEGEEMDCLGNIGFNTEHDSMTIGGYDPMISSKILPHSADDVYLHYRMNNGSETYEGWIEISFFVDGDTTAWLNIYSFLSGSASTSIESILPNEFNISIYPNPIMDGIVNVKSDVSLSKIELLSLNGKILDKFDVHDTKLNLARFQGLYFIRMTDTKNRSVIKKLTVH